MKILLALTTVLFLSTLASAQDKLQHAVELYRNGDYTAAVKEFEALNTSGAGSYQSYIHLGAANVHLLKEQEARDAFLEANKVKPAKIVDSDTPLRITRKEPPGVGDVSRDIREGRLSLAVEFKADGKIGFTFVVETTNYDFIKSCIKAAKQIAFKPAKVGGIPVDTVRIVEYAFFQ